MNYKKYLETEYWKEFRIRIINSRNNICEECKVNKLLQVHHLTYENIGNEKDEDVKVLCRSCHCKIHGILNESILPVSVIATIESKLKIFEKWKPYKEITKSRLHWYKRNHCYNCYKRFVNSEVICQVHYIGRYCCEKCSCDIFTNNKNKFLVLKKKNKSNFPSIRLIHISEKVNDIFRRKELVQKYSTNEHYKNAQIEAKRQIEKEKTHDILQKTLKPVKLPNGDYIPIKLTEELKFCLRNPHYFKLAKRFAPDILRFNGYNINE